MKITPSFLCLFFPLSLFAQNIWRVDAASTAPNPDGLSWSSAFADLHQVLATAQSGDEVWIAQGVYKPASDDDRWKAYNLPSGVALYGGFNGTETQRDQRDWIANPTILSGDIGIPGDSTDNSYGIIYTLNTNGLTHVDGLTIEEANADNTDINVPIVSPSRSGGGIYLNGSSQGGSARLNVYNCIFRHNRANYHGGGIFANGLNGGQAIVRLENCLFEKNRAGYDGGGVVVENNTDQPFPLEVTNCTFRDNYAPVSGSAAWLYVHQAVTFTDCLFSGNSQLGGGTVKIEGDKFYQPVLFQRCDFRGNQTNDLGSALYFRVYSTLGDLSIRFRECNFVANLGTPLYMYGSNQDYRLTVENCIFQANSGGDSPGVISWNSVSANSNVYFTNCLFYKNWKREFGGSFNAQESHFFIKNSVFIDQESGDQSYIALNDVPVVLDNCIVSHADCAQLSNPLFNNVICGPNVLFATDPLFINPNATIGADFHLQPCSPAINAGDNSILDSLGITTDLDGNPRIRHDQVDIGPFETSLFFDPVTITKPSCQGASDGTIVFGGGICAPFEVTWDGGSTTDTSVENLAEGLYYFTVTDANGLTLVESVSVSEPEPIYVVLADAMEISCFGHSDGVITLLADGGVPPYIYPPDSELTGLSAGVYNFTVTDANGCTGLIQNVVLNDPPPIEIAYTVQDASGPNIADGAIWIDTVFGGVGGTVTPPDLTGLLPGIYTITAADANNCIVTETIEVGYTVKTNEPAGDFKASIFPNPAATDEPVFVETLENEGGRVWVFDFQGNLLKKIMLMPNAIVPITNDFPAGLYRIEIRGESGKRTVLKWVVQ